VSDDAETSPQYENGTVRDEANINHTVVTEGAPPAPPEPEPDPPPEPAAEPVEG
jgi:hypothetical protein